MIGASSNNSAIESVVLIPTGEAINNEKLKLGKVRNPIGNRSFGVVE
jgi:hypothetical protein